MSKKLLLIIFCLNIFIYSISLATNYILFDFDFDKTPEISQGRDGSLSFVNYNNQTGDIELVEVTSIKSITKLTESDLNGYNLASFLKNIIKKGEESSGIYMNEFETDIKNNFALLMFKSKEFNEGICYAAGKSIIINGKIYTLMITSIKKSDKDFINYFYKKLRSFKI